MPSVFNSIQVFLPTSQWHHLYTVICRYVEYLMF